MVEKNIIETSEIERKKLKDILKRENKKLKKKRKAFEYILSDEQKALLREASRYYEQKITIPKSYRSIRQTPKR